MRSATLSKAAICLLALGPGLASADCDNAVSQMEMNICAGQEFERADHALNAEYRRYRSGLSGPGKSLLTRAQTQWVGFRDASCNFEASSVEGGSMQPMVYSMCLTDYTRERLQRIRALAACQLMPNPGKGCTD